MNAINHVVRHVGVLPILVALASCTTSKPFVSETAPQARIRVFNQHGAGVRLHPGKTCYFGETLLGIGDKGLQVSAGGWSASDENKTLGMPVPSDTPKHFHEYAVAAGEAMTVEVIYRTAVAMGGRWGTKVCGPIGGTFTPMAGHDYEVYMQSESGDRCELRMREVIMESGTIVTPPVKFARAGKCS